MATGRIKSYDSFGYYGTITPDEGENSVFFHTKVLLDRGLGLLPVHQSVSYDLKKEGNGRLVAVNIKPFPA